MKRLKNYIKLELLLLGLFFLCVLIFQLFVRQYADTYEQKMIEYRENLDTKEFSVGEFDKLFSESNVDVEFKLGEPKVVIISASEIIENIELKEQAGWLEIRQKSTAVRMNRDLKDASLITVYGSNLNQLRSDRNTMIKVIDELVNEEMKLESNGNSTLIVPLKSQYVSSNTNGNSQITVTGEIGELEVDTYGNSSFHSQACESNNVIARSHGNSSLRVRPLNKIEGHASGNSTLHVFGDLEEKNTKSSGNASVRTY